MADNYGGMPAFIRWLFFWYFVTHIPITLFIDAQSISSMYHPPAFTNLLRWYTETYGDFLMANPPPWFQAVVACELVMQLPFFFVAAYGFWTQQNWLRLPCIVYGSHVATTLVPILDAFARAPHLSLDEKVTLIGIYSPYLLVPVMLVVIMWRNERPFGMGLPRGHPKGGDVSKCPFASMMGLAAAEGLEGPAQDDAVRKKER